MRILVLGREVSDFMCPLFKAVREKYGVTADLFELRDKSQLATCSATSFDNILDIPLVIKKYPKSFILSAILSGDFIKQLFTTYNFRNAVRNSVLHKKIRPIFEQYDIVHVFFMTPELFHFFDALSTSKRLVVSMWGSDILQNNQFFDYNQQAKLISKADIVTVHQKEMRELFLSKYGREYVDKVREMLVVSDVSFLSKFINAIPNKSSLIISFKKRYGINDDKRIVVVGHSGHTIDNHTSIVKALTPYKGSIANRICLVFPMTYGCDTPDYFDEIAGLCNAMGVQFVILKSFLTLEEMIELRLASEVLLRLSKFDAFSLSLCETLCVGNVVVTGTWLPYSKLRGNGVHFDEVYEIEDIGPKLVDILDNYDVYASKCVNNASKVLAVFENENSVDKLNKIYTNE